MVRFLGVASLLFFSYIAVVAANSVPREQTSDAITLFGRAKGCPNNKRESYDDIQLKQLTYSFSSQPSALTISAAPKITIVAPRSRVDVRA